MPPALPYLLGPGKRRNRKLTHYRVLSALAQARVPVLRSHAEIVDDPARAAG
jgi:hypothetical protein